MKKPKPFTVQYYDFHEVDPEKIDLGEGGWIRLYERVFPDHQDLMAVLYSELVLKQETYERWNVPVPRLTGWYGDKGYRYSGIAHEPKPWTPSLLTIRDKIHALVKDVEFNSVLINLYRGGRDSVDYHADDEPSLGPTRDDIRIASVSLGAKRRFVLKHNHSTKKAEFDLGEGSVLIMGGTLQHNWKHSIRKTSKNVEPRMNLTYRVVT